MKKSAKKAEARMSNALLVGAMRRAMADVNARKDHALASDKDAERKKNANESVFCK